MSANVQMLRGGQSLTREHSDSRILAVVRGRLRVQMERGPGSPDTAAASLRSSDAMAIPAHAAYTVEALQDTEIFLYADRSPQPILWGV